MVGKAMDAGIMECTLTMPQGQSDRLPSPWRGPYDPAGDSWPLRKPRKRAAPPQVRQLLRLHQPIFVDSRAGRCKWPRKLSTFSQVASHRLPIDHRPLRRPSAAMIRYWWCAETRKASIVLNCRIDRAPTKSASMCELGPCNSLATRKLACQVRLAAGQVRLHSALWQAVLLRPVPSWRVGGPLTRARARVRVRVLGHLARG